MKKTYSQSIVMLFHEASKEFYARVEIERGEEVEGYYTMKDEDIAVIGAAYPHLAPYLDEKASPSERNIASINAAVAEYNKTHGKRSSVVWLICDFRKYRSFRQINDSALIAEIEKRRGSFIDVGYEGKYDYDEMTAFAESYASSSEFVVVNCEVCGKHRAIKINGDRAVCECGKIFRRSETVFVSKSRAAAIGKASDLNRHGGEEGGIDEGGLVPKPFYYEGNVYNFTAADCELLHKLLYADYAVAEVFTGEPVSGFTQKYESYLLGLSLNRIKPELYRERNRTVSEIRNSGLSCPDALYYFFNKYGMGGGVLRRMRGSKLYEFSSVGAYAAALVDARGETRDQLISLFDENACRYFFRDYEPTQIELSRLVHDVTGRFVYFRDDGDTDFGKNFMKELALRDGSEGLRGMFLQAITSDEAYWSTVKGAYTDECELITWCPDNYGWLCMMLYAVTGRKTLKFGQIEIDDSERGERTVRALIENAYKTRSERALKEYEDLCRLFELGLLDRLDALCAVRTKFGEGVIGGLKPLLLPAAEVPSVDAYLYCARISLANKAEVAVTYGDRCDTVFAHAKRAVEKGGAAVKDLIADGDIAAALEFMLDDAEKHRRTAKERFENLVRESDKLRMGK